MHRALALVLLILSLPCQVRACAVPVFRYALERWESDPFQLVVFTEGAVPEAMDKTLRDLEPVLTEKAVARVNFKITRVDVTKPVPALWTELWQAQKGQPLPRISLCTPEWKKGDEALWTGPLNNDSIAALTDSPKRREIAAHLLKGTAVVWLIVETEDKVKSLTLDSLIETESKRLSDAIMIPPGIGRDGVDVRSNLPIEVSFATVRVKLNDPAEAMLIRLLTNGDKPAEPMLYPMFGRARVLAAMPASTVNQGLLEETGRFICGACSCQVKAQNPGFDLLIKANWDSIFGDDIPPPPEPKLAPATKPVYVPIPSRKK